MGRFYASDIKTNLAYGELLKKIIFIQYISFFVIAVVQVFTEIIVFFAFKHIDNLTFEVPAYLVFFVITPIFFTLLTVYITFVLLKNADSVNSCAWIVSFAEIALFSNLYLCHNFFRLLFVIYLIPIMTSCVYSQKMLTLFLGLAAILLKQGIDIALRVTPLRNIYGLHLESLYLDIFYDSIFILIIMFSVCLCIFIIAMEDKKNTLETLSKDSLTGLYNRKSAIDFIEDNLKVSQDAVLILLDMDGFKAVNDTFGHPFGDAVIRANAECIKKFFRTTDCLCRMGGDEFMIYAPSVTIEVAVEKVKKIIAALDKDFTAPSGEVLHTGISAGIACFPVAGKDWEALYSAADRALYQAKHEGKGTYKIAP